MGCRATRRKDEDQETAACPTLSRVTLPGGAHGSAVSLLEIAGEKGATHLLLWNPGSEARLSKGSKESGGITVVPR